MHLQTQSVWFKTDKKGRAQYSKRGSIKNVLTKYYGSTKELNRRLDILSAIHADPKLTRKIGTERIDAKYNRMVNDPSVNVERASSPERNGRLEELWRIEQLNVLSDIGLKMAKQYDVDWQPATTYQTDGQHRTRDSYIEHERQTEQVERTNQEQLTKTSKELTDAQNELKRSKQELADSQRAVKREKQRISRLKQNINDSFENITGAKRPDNMNDMDAIRVIRYHVKSAKSERDKTEQENEALQRENQRLKQEQAQMKQLNLNQPWYVLRQLIVDVIQALMPVLRELDHDSVTGQKWRDSVTEQVDRQMKQSTLINTSKKPQKDKSKELER